MLRETGLSVGVPANCQSSMPDRPGGFQSQQPPRVFCGKWDTYVDIFRSHPVAWTCSGEEELVKSSVTGSPPRGQYCRCGLSIGCIYSGRDDAGTSILTPGVRNSRCGESLSPGSRCRYTWTAPGIFSCAVPHCCGCFLLCFGVRNLDEKCVRKNVPPLSGDIFSDRCRGQKAAPISGRARDRVWGRPHSSRTAPA